MVSQLKLACYLTHGTRFITDDVSNEKVLFCETLFQNILFEIDILFQNKVSNGMKAVKAYKNINI